jgi:glucose/mannose transport system substrate-binding protein
MNKPIIAVFITILVILFIFLFLVLNNPGILMQNKVKSADYDKDNTLEIFSWWTAGGEAEGLKELYKLYEKYNPGVNIINATVVGGSGANAKAVLHTRMESNRPPDSFQVLAGPELIDSWVKPGLVEPLTFLFKENGWMSKFSPDALERVTYNGEIYAVPLNIHRGNLIWFNSSIFNKYDITPPETLQELLNIMEILAEKGITPLALGDKNIWPAAGILENILIAHFGADGYNSLWEDATMWHAERMEPILMDFLKILEYTNSNHAALTWDEAVQYVIDGKCAMISIGDFAEGYFRSEGFVPGKNFGWFPYPGTKGIFSMISDIFTLPRNAEHRENALHWLRLLGSKEGQDVFNPIKGSISARLDSDIHNYDEYLKSSSKSYSSEKIIGSFVHGGAINDGWAKKIIEISRNLMIDKDIMNAVQKLQSAADKHLGIKLRILRKTQYEKNESHKL